MLGRDLRALWPDRAVPAARGLSSPRISRIAPFESPVSGKEITSWGEREREMRAFDCFDPRDLPRDHSFKRGREAQAKEQQGFPSLALPACIHRSPAPLVRNPG